MVAIGLLLHSGPQSKRPTAMTELNLGAAGRMSVPSGWKINENQDSDITDHVEVADEFGGDVTGSLIRYR